MRSYKDYLKAAGYSNQKIKFYTSKNHNFLSEKDRKQIKDELGTGKKGWKFLYRKHEEI